MTMPRAYGDPMSTDRWQRVQDLFVAALECDGTARARFIGDECRDDPELLREVESLLAAHERPGALDRLAPAMAPGVAHDLREGETAAAELVGHGQRAIAGAPQIVEIVSEKRVLAIVLG
jgi:hypothetical protein